MLISIPMKRPLLALLLFTLWFCQVRADLGSRLPRSTPEAEGVDSGALLALVEALDTKIDAVHSLMLLRHGKVIAEGWRSPYTAGDVHILYSATKSFTSTAVGFAVQEGRLSINDTVLSFFPDLAPKAPSAQMKAMRIRDLLRMSSGHQRDTVELMRARADGQWRRAFLESALEHKPGTHFVYNSGASYMLSAIVQKVTGQTLDAYLQPRLFEPLGIVHHPWGLSPEGIALGDGGLSVTTEDLAKFGQFYLQRGVWKGSRLLSEQWIDAATSLQTSNGSDPDSDWEHGYGYQFWRNRTTGYRADGAMGQFCFVLPEHEMVLAVTSGTSDMKGVMDLVWQYLLPAIRTAALPANPVAQGALAHSLSSLRMPVATGAARSSRLADISGQTYVFPENEQGVTSVALDFSASKPLITFNDADGTHVIPCGIGEWTRSSTTFRKRISSLFDREHQGLAACGAWASDETFVAKLCFVETPYTITATFTFAGDQVFLDMMHNQRWGETRRPRIIGRRQLAR